MGLIGFVLLFIGGVLMLLSGQSLVIDPAMQATLITFIETILPGYGATIVNILVIATSLGGIGVVIGAIIWYAAGEGIIAWIGKTVVSLSTFSAFFVVIIALFNAFQAGVFSQPLHQIISYFASLGLGFISVVLVLIGSFLGAARKRD